MTTQQTIDQLQAQIDQLKEAATLQAQVDQMKADRERAAQIKGEASPDVEETPKKKMLTGGGAAALVGLGAVLAPFTGGMSLAYAAAHMASAAAVDNFAPKSWDEPMFK